MKSDFYHAPPIVRTFSRFGLRRLDEEAIHRLRIPGVVLMENAAAAIQEAALRLMRERRLKNVLVLVGPGNNGGDGLAVARRLHNRKIPVSALLSFDFSEAVGEAQANVFMALGAGLGLPEFTVAAADEFLTRGPALIIDALLGIGPTRAPRDPIRAMIAWVNRVPRPPHAVLAVDLPSGLDCDTGAPLGDEPVRADLTITIAGMKRGFANPSAKDWTGPILVGDLCVPNELLCRMADRESR